MGYTNAESAMPDGSEGFRYIRYLGARYRFIVVSVVVACLLAAGLTLLQRPKYTATARILIEPPAGTDLRAAMAVSPIYLESLRTYEQFATSDTLFRTAIDVFHLRDRLGSKPIEALKRQILRTELIRNTKVLEIRATLPDARDAHALAQYLAEQTVALSRTLGREGDRDLVAGFERQQSEASERRKQTQSAWTRLLATEPLDDLEAEIENSAKLRRKLAQRLFQAEVRAATGRSGQSEVDVLRRQQRELDRDIAAKQSLLASRTAHRQAAEAEKKAAEANWMAAETRLRDARSESGYRGERLKVIDPGIVPERPSSPNLPLNTLVAGMLAVLGAIVYLAIEMNFRGNEREVRDLPLVMRRGGDG
jgi:uncharacterized protein involved in exopolysaccharide biosynthesis